MRDINGCVQTNAGRGAHSTAVRNNDTNLVRGAVVGPPFSETRAHLERGKLFSTSDFDEFYNALIAKTRPRYVSRSFPYASSPQRFGSGSGFRPIPTVGNGNFCGKTARRAFRTIEAELDISVLTLQPNVVGCCRCYCERNVANPVRSGRKRFDFRLKYLGNGYKSTVNGRVEQ